jgi:enoyl-CoA hydratase
MSVVTSMIGTTMILRIERPPVNALDLDAIDELRKAFDAVEGAKPKGGVVLTGDGQVFCTGVDTRAFAAYDRQQRHAMVLAITRMTARLLAISVPVVAAINGHALGGGFVLMLGCDYRLASDVEASKLGMTEAKAGIPFPAGPLEIIHATLGPDLLRRLTLTSDVLGVRELLQAGVLDRLCPPKELIATAAGCAAHLAQQPGFSHVKRQIRGPLAHRLHTQSANGEDAFLAYFD